MTASKKLIPLSRPWIGADGPEIAALNEVFTSRWLSTGPKTGEFEQRFSEYIGVKHAIAVSSCTAATHLALHVSGVTADDEVITTPYTYTATSEAIGYTGAKPVMVDINPVTLNLAPAKVESAITPRTRAILTVHIAGYPCDMATLTEISQQHNLALIDDAAHGLSSVYQQKMIGNTGDFSAFSFHATKNLAIGEGGMVTTNSDQLAERLRIIRHHGITKDAWQRQAQGDIWYYEVTEQGFKYNMSDVQAAIGLCQLAKLEKQLEIRHNLAQIYLQELDGIPEIKLPPEPLDGRHAWHLFIIQLDCENLNVDRSQFIREMRAENIECGVHYIPLHLFPYYQQTYGYQAGDFPVAESAYSRVVSLPMHPLLEVEDVYIVAETIKRIIKSARLA